MLSRAHERDVPDRRHVSPVSTPSTASSAPPRLGGAVWNTYRAGDTRTARQFVDDASVLLHEVAARAGSRNDRHLVGQLGASLTLGHRESTLPREAVTAQNPELAGHAVRIGEDIAGWARRALSAHRQAAPSRARALDVRSRCDGHVWTRDVAALLTGADGSPAAMQLYNEWLHQMVLLRDALLPFDNWQDVPLPVGPDGLRRLDRAREAFLAELTTRRARHTAIVSFARAAATGTDGPDGYGFSTPLGTALPQAVTRPHGPASRLLLWSAGSGGSETATFVSAVADYYAEQRSDAADVARADALPGDGAAVTGRLVLGEPDGGVRTAVIEVTDGRRSAAVDLGQALRGHRHAYRSTGPAATSAPAPVPSTTLPAWSVLAAPGMTWSPRGTFVVHAPQDALACLALLGKLYPENVLLFGEGTAAPAGKSGPARFELRTP